MPTSKTSSILRLILAATILVLLAHQTVVYAASSRIIEGAVWSYLVETGRGPAKWTHTEFDDSTWLKGPSGFGFGKARYNTRVDALRSVETKLFIRHGFHVNNPNRIKKIMLLVLSDGPFIAYMNGIEVIRSSQRVTETIDITGFADELFPGNNMLAIESFNDRIETENFAVIPMLEIVEE